MRNTYEGVILNPGPLPASLVKISDPHDSLLYIGGGVQSIASMCIYGYIEEGIWKHNLAQLLCTKVV